jgi:hypothetical protein
MGETSSERRLAENEVIFRQANEKAVKTLEVISKQEAEEKVNNTHNGDLTLYFYCECADDKCKERIKLTTSNYKNIHNQSNIFIIIPGHELPEIEKVVKQFPDYFVVQKYMTPPKNPTKLHSKKKNTKKR